MVSQCAILFVATGCESPPAVGSNTVFPEDQMDPRQALGEAQAGEVHRALASAVPAGAPIVRPVVPAMPRWSDAPIAMAGACAGLEMAIVSRKVSDEEMVFRIKTLNNRPGEMTLRRTVEPPGYRLDGWIGRFGDPALVAKLSEQFDERMEVLRTRPSLEDFRPSAGR